MPDNDKLDSLKESLKEGEVLVKGTITRVVDRGQDVAPLVFFHPETDVRFLHLEGHRVTTGELMSDHEGRTANGTPIPKQFDGKRVAIDGDFKVGSRIGLVYLDRQR
jgi:hypothetical protein